MQEKSSWMVKISLMRPKYKRARVIGRLFQDPMKGTAPHMTIEENLGLAYSRGKRTTLSKAIKKGDRKFFLEQLASLGLGLEERITTNVGLLSGGQRQALTLLMATIVTPKLLLLDEHTAGFRSENDQTSDGHHRAYGERASYYDAYDYTQHETGIGIWQ